MAGEKFIALEETSQEIKASVDNMKSNVDGLKTTDVPAIDTLVDEVLKRIGLTGDTGGSANLGSVMAKLNEIIGKVGKSGSEISTTGFGTTVFEHKDIMDFYYPYYRKVIAKFIAPVTGAYNIKFLAKCTESGRVAHLDIYNPPDVKQLVYYASSTTRVDTIYKPYNLLRLINTVPVGEEIGADESFDEFFNLAGILSEQISIESIPTTEQEYNNLIYCRQGDPVFLYVGSTDYSFRDFDIRNIVITYGNK